MENNKKPKQPNKPPKQERKEEKLSWEDLEDLMGVHRQILHKKNGVWHRR